MPGSPLSFPNTQSFRNDLVRRNLVPYRKSPRPATPPINYEIVQSDYSVIDSPDQLIDNPTLANRLYPLNQYGSAGGYVQTRDPNRLLNVNPNEGEYDTSDATIINQATTQARNYRTLNPYGSGSNTIIDSAESFESLEILQLQNRGTSNSQPYPTTFLASSYSPYSILFSNNPTGNNGPLSQDSFIARLGAKVLKKEFEERIAAELYRQTLGRANLPGVNPGLTTIGLINGTVPLIQPNYIITVPANPITYAADFALRLAGTRLPFSPIPGSYFDPTINPGQPTTIQQLQNAYNNTIGQTAVGQFLSNVLGTPKTGSEIFLNNTGPGQKRRLFFNIDFNRYKPNYERNLLGAVVGAIFGTSFQVSDYYVGSPTSEPSRVSSPGGEIPINDIGIQVPSPVYGPVEMAKLYEGDDKTIKIVSNGPIYSNGGGIEGGLTWVSPKYKGNAGKKVGVGGQIIKQDTDFKESSFNSTESTNTTFRGGSIMDETQRLINSQPKGGRRLQHVGNAIDQVSKVFNDGYKEMTKGSRVLAYVGEIGQEVGAEYCRVFAKDTPYLQYNDLQKTDGMTTEGRRFQYSVLDKTYNLNIYPNKMEGGQDSTNLIGGTGDSGKVKKYMFSLENLAWRTSNRPGFTYADLPICERGPNGGRIMWFPPYELKFTESVTANWKTTDFLGRPEPIYTYNNTSRSGTISWKIVVDHPSTLNIIVDKVLANQSNKEKINSIVNSFFAGCRKYDIYDLTKKYYTFSRNDFLEIQKELNYKDVTTERIEYIKKTETVETTGVGAQVSIEEVPDTLSASYVNKSAFFENDFPKPDEEPSNYEFQYLIYESKKTEYENQNPSTTTFFTSVIEKNFSDIGKLAEDIGKLLSDTSNSGNITLTIGSSCSAPATINYNKSLSQRRIDSLKKYFQENVNTMEYINATDRKLILENGEVGGETATVPQYNFENGGWVQGNSYSCTDNDGSDGTGLSQEIYTIKAMACRRAYIQNIRVNLTKKTETPGKEGSKQNFEYESQITTSETTKVPEEVTKTNLKDNITKRLLRNLLTECNYFEMIKEETPMVFDNIKDKLKFFDPAFHSTTPEGLNSRLTFLQQCLRPGDTIPSIGSDGKLKYDDAINTAFGVPPILVLRVGDFYHTKIAPSSLQLSYETLDINPEGIGVQPMIATVSMGFNFIGGHGLASAVDRLQNALSFNYYANTEIYDERAETTDESYKVLDKEFIDYFNVTVPPPTINQAPSNNGSTNSQTIGKIVSSSSTTEGEVGVITYQAFFNSFLQATKTYFQTVLNKNKEVASQLNNGIRELWTLNRNYINGHLLYDSFNDTEIFGKPSEYESKIDKIFNDFVEDIENDNEGLIYFVKGTTINPKNFSSKVIKQLKKNYTNYIKNTKRGNYESSLTKIIQDLTIAEQTYTSYLNKLNTLTFTSGPGDYGMDGLQESNGYVKIYLISGTSKVDTNTTPTPTDTFEELEFDTRKVRSVINDFNDTLTGLRFFTFNNVDYTGKYLYENEDFNDTDIFVAFTDKFDNNDIVGDSQSRKTSLRRSYMILNDEIVDSVKYNNFKSALIGNILSDPKLFGTGPTNLEQEFDAYWNNYIKSIFVEENQITAEFLKSSENGAFKVFIDGKVGDISELKGREFTFTTKKEDLVSQGDIKDREKLIKSLGASVNSSTDKKYWNDISDNVYIGKVKFN